MRIYLNFRFPLLLIREGKHVPSFPWSLRRRIPSRLYEVTENHYRRRFIPPYGTRGFFTNERRKVDGQADVAPLSSSVSRSHPPFAVEWRSATQSAVDSARSMMNEIRNCVDNGNATARDVLLAFDRVSEVVCAAVDASEVSRTVSTSDERRGNAFDGGNIGRLLFHELNADPVQYFMLMYGRTVPVDEADREVLHAQWWADLSVADRRAAELFRHDFETGGIHLTEEKRKTLIDLNEKSDAAAMEIYDEPRSEAFSSEQTLSVPSLVLAEEDARALPFLPQSCLSPMHHDGGDRLMRLNLSHDSSEVLNIMHSSPSQEARRRAYLFHHSDPVGRRFTFERLAAARHALASHCGHESFAAMALSDRLAQTPTRVDRFLQQIASALRPHAEREIEELRPFLRHGHSTASSQMKFHDWDFTFCKSKLLAQQRAQARNALLPDPSAFFSLTNCLRGLNMLCSRLFNMSLVRVPTRATERADGLEEVWHPSVIKCALVDAPDVNGPDSLKESTNNVIGYIYFDLFHRFPKTGEAACFPMTFGRQIGSSSSQEYSVGSVAMVTSFGNEQLTHSECVTLFHEFGHAFHNLVGRRTEYQHVAGTRGPPDFVEVPSTLFERFAWDARVLPLFARHRTSGAPITNEQVGELHRHRSLTPAMETLHQVVISSFDQALHSSEPPVTTGASTEVARELWSKCYDTLLPSLPANVHWQVSFTHAATYGANYYSYLWSRMLAAGLWERLFAEDPLSANSGGLLLKRVLRYGNAKRPAEMLSSIDQPDALEPEYFSEEFFPNFLHH